MGLNPCDQTSLFQSKPLNNPSFRNQRFKKFQLQNKQTNPALVNDGIKPFNELSSINISLRACWVKTNMKYKRFGWIYRTYNTRMEIYLHIKLYSRP